MDRSVCDTVPAVRGHRHLKKKEIWLISDRLTKADDNGEAGLLIFYCNENFLRYLFKFVIFLWHN